MNHMRRSWWQVLATLVAFTLISAACGGGNGDDAATDTTLPPQGLIGGDDEDEGDGSDDGSGPEYGGRIVVALEAETDNWLPGQADFVVPNGSSVAHTIYDPLMILNEDDKLVPYLAESMEPNDDLTEWTLTLRPDITFHDGSPLDAETLVWNFDTLHDQPGSNTAGSIANNGIEEVEAIDDLTVVYRLSGPNAALADSLRNSLGWPVSRQAYEEMGADEFAENPVGTGPFEFQEWTRDDRLVVTRNENYWRTDEDGNQLPYLDEIEFRPITDEDSRYQSLAADSVQVMVTLRGSTAKQVLSLADERNYRGNLYYGNQSGSSIFNTERPPVDDLRVRRALVAASDGEAVAIVLGDDGLVPPTNQFFNDESPWYSEVAAEAYPAADGPDLELAAELMTDYVNDPDRSDGKAPGEPVDLEYACLPDPSLIEIGQLYQQDWGDIAGGGYVNVNLRQVEQAEHVSNGINGDYMINCWRAGAGAGDPLTQLQSFFSDPETNPLNFTNFGHPEIDEALVDLRTNLDFEVRYAAAETINRIANENSVMTWSIATPTLVGWRDDIHGFTTWRLPDGDLGNGTPGGHMHFSQVWMEQ